MPEFLTLLPPNEALQKLVSVITWKMENEIVSSDRAFNRVTYAPVTAAHPLPAFSRSTVDGYALRAVDTFGASEGLPAYFRVAGEVPMGSASDLEVKPGQCVLIHTGGMLPEGADAVVMLEYTQTARPGEIEVLRPAAHAENVLIVGEDVKAGEEVIPAGKRLLPADIGGLMALGITDVSVYRQPRAAILSSGDEVVPPSSIPGPGQVRDINSYSLSALVIEAGGIPVRYGILPDRADALQAAAEKALVECDLVIITAGSSASSRDLTADVINRLGTPGVLVHGVNVRPGKPTILGVCGGKPVIGLPGNPVSALVIAGLFIPPVIDELRGVEKLPFRPSLLARLSINMHSESGREDWIPVRLDREPGGYRADPIFGKSNLIFSLARADGLARIPPNATGAAAGEFIEVFLF